MKIATLAAAAALSLCSTLAFAQATNAPGASTIGGDPNPNVNSPSSAGGSATQTGGGMSGGNTMQRGSGMTTGSSQPAMNDASKSGAPASDNAMKPPGTTTPDNSTQRR